MMKNTNIEVSYSSHGDYLEVLFDAKKNFNAKWVSPFITLLTDRDTGENNGFIVENFQYLMKRIEKKDDNG